MVAKHIHIREDSIITLQQGVAAAKDKQVPRYDQRSGVCLTQRKLKEIFSSDDDFTDSDEDEPNSDHNTLLEAPADTGVLAERTTRSGRVIKSRAERELRLGAKVRQWG